MALTPEEIQAYREELAALKAARAKLLSGSLAVRATIDGDMVEYHQVDIAALNRRISELEAIIGDIDSPGSVATAFNIVPAKGL